jgi:hypothetical protein
MAIGTDKELFKNAKKRIKPAKNGKGGRPRVNEDLVIRLLKSKTSAGFPRYNMTQIAKSAKCSAKTVTRIKKRAIESGLLVSDDRLESALSITEADFEQECIRAKGFSFIEWMKPDVKRWKYIFNFCEKVWINVWDRPNLVDVRDYDNPLGDQLCIKFIQAFGDDKKRIRGRKKTIRYIFRFLGRGDLCDMHLRMKKSSDPVPVRRVPEISMVDFPMKLQKVVDMMTVFFPDAFDIIYGKICMQVRTGNAKAEREYWGLKKGSDSGKSYIIMSDMEHFRIHYFCKLSEDWDIQWLPYEIRKRFWAKYNKLNHGDYWMKGISVEKFREKFRQITTKIFGRNLTLHDLRKVSITWFYVLGIRLEIATVLNVGWADLNTPRDHYLEIGRVLKSSFRQEYADNIPDWFKEGLQEFMTEEAYDKIRAD